MADYPDLLERIRRGVGVSVEMAAVTPLPPGETTGEPLAVTHPNFIGTLRYGQNLLGVALTDHPAAAGSILWAVK